MVVVFAGITIVFIVPRMTPLDPVQSMINQIQQFGAYTDPEAMRKFSETVRSLYGLDGSILQQYARFWGQLARLDLGPSFSYYPTPVSKIIVNALPWTGGLMGISVVVTFFVANFLGTYAGYFSESRLAKVISGSAVVIYPIPYAIVALVMVIVFVFTFPVFPMLTGAPLGSGPSGSLGYLWALVKNNFLPAFSLVLINTGGGFLLAQSLTSNVKAADYVVYAEAAGLPRMLILNKYIKKNIRLPRITQLAISLGMIFNGALVTEYIFAYPGLGMLLYSAIRSNDFNLMTGITLFSIVGVSLMTFLVDMLYPLLDPRVRYR